jgi:hypothetical protein
MSLTPEEHSKKQEDEFRNRENLSHNLSVIWTIAALMSSTRGNISRETLDNGCHVILESVDRARELCGAA